MTEGDLLYQDILAQPDCDDVRLIWADWLSDQNQPGWSDWADFVRLQVDLHHEEPGYCLDFASSLKIHEQSANPKIRQALQAYQATSTAVILQDARLPGRCIRRSWSQQPCWQRGFIDAVTTDYYDWSRIGNWKEHYPLLRWVYLRKPVQGFRIYSIGAGQIRAVIRQDTGEEVGQWFDGDYSDVMSHPDLQMTLQENVCQVVWPGLKFRCTRGCRSSYFGQTGANA